jgi:saccharopine dehydrogenase-like NADP-dependent oxidoreductase
MYEKTLRYPGYAEKIKFLNENGFFDTKKQDINGKKISPMELTSKLLFKQWKLKDNEVDLTVMRIIVEGELNGGMKRFTYELYDELDQISGIHSMARTTGYTASAALRMLNTGLYTETGVCFPETLGSNHKIVDFMLNELKKRNIIYKEKIEDI